jgi:uncharacterized RDD family membrane protein YckC
MTRYAGFWIRALAALLDTVFILAIVVPPLLLIYGVHYFTRTDLSTDPVDIFFNWVLPFGIWMAFWLVKSATPGKIVLHLEIVDARTLGKPTWLQFLGRYIGYFLSTIPLGIGLIWAAFDARKRAWHDLLAGTLVVYKDKD